jgi:polar amino acid transport system substrate-binding protein
MKIVLQKKSIHILTHIKQLQFNNKKRAMLKKHFSILGIIFLCFQATHCLASDNKEAPTLYFDLGEKGGWVPFRNAAKNGGTSIFTELSKTLEADSGIQFKTVHFPQKRAAKALIDGIVDFDFSCLEWFKNNDPGPGFVATEPFFEITEYIVTLSKNTHLFPTPESIYGKHVGTISGYFYFDDDQFIRTDFLNENQLIQGLKNNRFKAIILERETAKYWAKLNNTEIGFAALHTSGNLIIRLRKEHSALIPSLNRAIQKMKTSGKLQAILSRQGIDSKIYTMQMK